MTDQSKLIILIEDEPSLRDALKEALVTEGYQVSAAADGESGLALILDSQPSVVLLDIMMPVMDGIEVLEKMRRSPEHVHTPVMLLTNASSQEYIAKGMEYDIAGYLIKSDWSLERLVEDIRQIIAHES